MPRDLLSAAYAFLREVVPGGRVLDLLAGTAARAAAEWPAAVEVVALATVEVEGGAPLASPSALPVASGAFDLVVAPARALEREPDGALAELRRVLTPTGLLAVAMRGPDEPALLEGEDPGAASPVGLEGALRRSFPHVSVFAQRTLVAASLSRAGVPPAPLPFDALEGSALPAPSHFVVLATRRHRRWPDGAAVALDGRERDRAVEARLARLEAALELVRGEVDRRAEALARLGQELSRHRGEHREAEARRAELQALLEDAEARAAAADAKEGRAARAEARAEALAARLDRLASQLVEAQQALGLAEVRLFEAEGRGDRTAELLERLEGQKAEAAAAAERAAAAVRRCDDLAEEAATAAAAAEAARRGAAEAEARAAAAEAERAQAGAWAAEAERRLDEARSALEGLARERRRWAAEKAAAEERAREAEERAARAEAAVDDARRLAETREAEVARLEELVADRAVRLAELESEVGELRVDREAMLAAAGPPTPVPADDRTAALEEELAQERRRRAAEVDNLRLHAEARLAQAWELGERLDRSTRELERLRKELDETRSSPRVDGAWALVTPESTLPPELLPELVAVLHQGRTLRSLLARLAAVAVAPPPDPQDDLDA